MKSFAFAATAALVALSTVADSPPALTPLGTLKTGPLRGEDPRIAEINAYDPAGRRIYVVNPLNGRLDVIDASDPAAPLADVPLDLVSECQSALGTACPLVAGGEPNSVAIQGPLLVVADANAVRTANGHAVFFKLRGADKPLFL